MLVRWLTESLNVRWSYYPTAGGPYPLTELFIVDIESRRLVPVEAMQRADHQVTPLRWADDGSEFYFLSADRYGQRVDLVAADPETGARRIILTEEKEVGLGASVLARLLRFLGDGERLIWLSDRDGWRHVYLYGLDGTLIRQLTDGQFPVREVVAIDEDAGWVYFIAQGDPERVYDTHLYRVSLDGGAVVQLTEGVGRHAVQFSPSGEFFLDTYSTAEVPPVVELRGADGVLLQTLSTANIDALVSELNWHSPEEFVVKAADGGTDIYGHLYKPFDFDQDQKYPVIEVIYGIAEPLARRTFAPVGPGPSLDALAQLGFIVFVVDSRGTAGRGREFGHAVLGNIGRYEIPDHVAALRQVAEGRPYMDLSRVGIFGYSYGGYMAVRAMLLAPEVYHVGVAGAAISDMADHSGNEVLIGSPEDNRDAYAYASNLPLAANLHGKLLMIHGTMDALVPFSHIMRMADAFDRAGKSYDMLVVPDVGHVSPLVYAASAIPRYFQEHLNP